METRTDHIPTEESRPLTGVSILLVEDNEVNILVARTFLERWGATIDVATNGQEALDKVDVSRHKLVLMDMHMPVMDGYEACAPYARTRNKDPYRGTHRQSSARSR
jgi:CheY-like chemotaxis protein